MQMQTTCTTLFYHIYRFRFQVVSSDIMPELAKQASSTLLQMLVNLRYWYHQCNANTNETANALAYKPLTGTGGGTDQRLTLGPQSNSLNLKYILTHIIDWIIMSGVSSQKLKINLYASLLNFMHIIKGINSKSNEFSDTPSET